MLIGIGTDILRMERIADEVTCPDSPFMQRVYTGREREEAARRADPRAYYGTRFAGKEAVYKCLGQGEEELRLNEIEILTRTDGAPVVTLHGACLRRAQALGVERLRLSLSYETEYAVAFAAAEGKE